MGRDTFLPYTFTIVVVVKYEPLKATAGKQFLRPLFQNWPLLLFSSVPGFTSGRRERRAGVELFIIITNTRKKEAAPPAAVAPGPYRACKWRRHARTIVLAPRAWTKCNARRWGLMPRHSLQTFAVRVLFLRAIGFGFARVREAEAGRIK